LKLFKPNHGAARALEWIQIIAADAISRPVGGEFPQYTAIGV
jgi:hypothetical protein